MVNPWRVIMRGVVALIGLVVAIFGGWLLVLEMQKPVSHPGNVYTFAAMIGFGCLIIIPAAITSAVKQIIVVVGPYLPEIRIGGRRWSDRWYRPPRPDPASPPADDVP